MRAKLLIFLFILVILPSLSHAVAQQSITISGVVTDASLEGETIRFQYYDHYSFFGSWPTSHDTEVRIKDGKFLVKVTNIPKVGYLVITLPQKYASTNGIPFLAQQNDDLTLNLNNGEISFSGKGSEKYNCQTQLVHIEPNYVTVFSAIDSTYFPKQFQSYDRWVSKKLDLLQTYKQSIEQQAYDLIKLNILYLEDRYKMIGIKYYLESENNIEREVAKSAFVDYLNKKAHYNIPNKNDLDSYAYYDYELEKSILISRLNCNKFNFYSVFHDVNKMYKGTLRDRLLLTLTIGEVSFRDSTDFYRDQAIDIVTDPFCLNALKSKKSVLGKGSLAYNFHLQDTTGRIISLSDFKGKLVVLDYYFTGCSGCVHMARNMPEVLSAFPDTSKIVFITINLDKNMSMFKKAVKSGLYTHEGNINLYTNGEADKHPLVQYYNIIGCPFLMVVDQNSNILNSDPPYPGSRPNATLEFINILKDQIAKM
ncbi:TlpA family protein disulfide reductase [Chryseobacterium sp. 22543]|uniref:TlpA family protein disulfide reductase n=1 Tax=Chryseobacterium sp. 22543 TaxID=3453940 RepID=UPI003F82A653